MTAPAPGGRIAGLNAWRAILMMLGIVLHASLWQAPTPLFVLIDLCSSSFRMGAFFIISGMLTGLSLRGRPIRGWLRRRLRQIGLPTGIGLGVICPTITLILRAMPADRLVQRPVWLDWYHCWFLVGLLLFAALASLGEAADRRFRLIDRFDARVAATAAPGFQLAAILWLAVIVFGLIGLTSAALARLVPMGHLHAAGQLRFVAGYAPIYAFGFLLARAPAFSARMLGSAWQPALVLLLVALVYLRQFWLLPHGTDDAAATWDFAVRAAGAALAPAAAAILILRSALAMRRVPMVLERLCDASFTLYLVHMPLIAALSLATVRLPWGPYAAFASIAAASGLIGYAFHVLVVRRVPIVSLALNGRRPLPLTPLPERPAGGGAAYA